MVTKNIYMIAYDITSNTRRRRISKLLEAHGLRMNKSVFECMLSPFSFNKLMHEIQLITDVKKDSVLAYPICRNCYENSERGRLYKYAPLVIAV